MSTFLEITNYLKEFSREKLTSLNKAFNNTVDKLARTYVDELKQQANSALGSTKKEYVNSIVVERVNDSEVSVKLNVNKNSKLAQMIENGAPAFDMKTGLLNSGKAKISSKGIKYIRIPIGGKGSDVIRTVTENTASGKWIHPGFQPKDLMNKTYQSMNVNEELDKELKKELDKVKII